ncbi:MAG: sulfatase-like hydrolase/transferase [Planctomycetes bacterium]|nr:sulfatase-like hydrolase/transferase [Planctomycetota bacterium]
MNRARLFGFEERIRALGGSTITDPGSTQPLIWFSPATAAVVLLLGFLLAGLIDLALGRIWELPSTPTSAVEIAGLVLGLALAVGAGAGLVATALLRLLGRRDGGGRGAFWLLLTVLVLLGLHGCRDRLVGLAHAIETRTLLPLGLVLLGALLTTWLWLRLLRGGERGNGNLLRIGLSLLIGAALLTGLHHDVRWTPGTPLALLALTLGLSRIGVQLEDRVPARASRVLPVVALLGLVGGALVWRDQSSDRAVDLARLVRDRNLPSTRYLLDLLDPGPRSRARRDAAPRPDPDRMIADAFATTDRSAALDALLGSNRRHFNLVLITCDDLRLDSVGWMGASRNGRSPTPALDRLAGQSLVFDRAYASCPDADEACWSRRQGRYPRWCAEGAPDLAEILAGSGYETLEADATRLPARHPGDADAAEVTAAALDLIARRAPGRPFLLELRYRDPAPSYRRHAAFAFGDRSPDLHQGEVAWMDRGITPLLDRLDRGDLIGTTIVVFLGNNGRAFGGSETGLLHEARLRVPLLLRAPGLVPGHDDRLVGLVDLVPSLLGLLGRARPAACQGRDLADAVLGIPGTEAGFAWVEGGHGSGERGLVVGDRKLRTDRTGADDLVAIGRTRCEETPTDEVGARERIDLVAVRDRLETELANRAGGPPATEVAVRAATTAALAALAGPEGPPRLDALRALLALRRDDPGRDAGGATAALEDELGRTLRSVAGDERRSPAERRLAFELLTTFTGAEVAPLMRAGLQIEEAEVRDRAALWLAERGDPSLREPLLAALAARDPSFRLQAAPALANLGERPAIRWLLPTLTESRPERAAVAVAGLARLGLHDLDVELAVRLGLGLEGLESRAGLLATATAVAGLRGDAADLVLARIARARWSEPALQARAALERRCSAARRAGLDLLAEQEILGDRSLLDDDPEAALLAYDEALRLAVGLGIAGDRHHLAAARCLVASGEIGAARARLKKLLASARPGERTTVAARALLEELAGPGVAFDPGALVVEVLESVSAEDLVHGRPFAVELRLRNLGTRQLAGDVWPRAPRIFWAFRDAEGRLRLPDRRDAPPVAFLPPEGLAAGAALELFSSGRLPATAGRHRPVLVLAESTGLDGDARPLLELPAIEVR